MEDRLHRRSRDTLQSLDSVLPAELRPQSSWLLHGSESLALWHRNALPVSQPVVPDRNQLANVFDAEIDLDATVEWFRTQNEIAWQGAEITSKKVLALAPYCSELGNVREYAPDEWVKVLDEKLGGERAAIVLRPVVVDY